MPFKISLQFKLLGLPRFVKQAIAAFADACMALIAIGAAFFFKTETLSWPTSSQWMIYLIAPLLVIPIFMRLGLYRAVFRYTGLSAMLTVVKAVLIYGFLYLTLIFLLKLPGMPLSVGLLQCVLFLILVGGSRMVMRVWLHYIDTAQNQKERLGHLLIYGAGSAGVQIATALLQSRQFDLVGFIDDAKHLHGKTINGLKIYSPTSIGDLILKESVTDMLLAIPSASRTRRNEILLHLKKYKVHVRSLPGLVELAQGKVTVSDIQDLEIADLLGRDPVQPNLELMEQNISSKVILVTGAGGSIGSELCRQIFAFKPSKLLLLDHNEFGLYTTHSELKASLSEGRHNNTELIPLLGSVSDYERMSQICRIWQPHTVYHAAAYKHVPLVEHNLAEGISNNVFGTLNMARVAMENSVACFVLISTDKAVRPTNIMGASKRLAEMILQALSQVTLPAKGLNFLRGTNNTCFSMVRFGNVLDSSGSVVPLFRKQIKEGGPVTVTDPQVTRYFMTIPEAAQLVIQAAVMAKGGEVFVLDMGEPVKIFDLACRMIELSGLKVKDAQNPNGDIEIAIAGLRTGEKLFEELLIGENPMPTDHVRIMKAHENFVAWDILSQKLDELMIATKRNDIIFIRNTLSELVSGFKPAKEIVDLIVCEQNKLDFDQIREEAV